MLSLFAWPIHLLLKHGYLALFLWSVTEGEIGLMLSGWLASEGQVFTYKGIIAVAISGILLFLSPVNSLAKKRKSGSPDTKKKRSLS